MRKIFILFALVFSLVTAATATVVTTAMTSAAAFAQATRQPEPLNNFGLPVAIRASYAFTETYVDSSGCLIATDFSA